MGTVVADFRVTGVPAEGSPGSFTGAATLGNLSPAQEY
jgi:hypothetical protein